MTTVVPFLRKTTVVLLMMGIAVSPRVMMMMEEKVLFVSFLECQEWPLMIRRVSNKEVGFDADPDSFEVNFENT